MRRFATLVIFFTSPLAANVDTLSIEKTVQEAIKKKPSIHAYHHSIKSFERKQKGTLSTFLPNITLTEKFYNTTNTSNIKSSFSIVASQTLINLAQIDYHKLYGTYVSSAKHEKESHVDTIRLATETTYLEAWLLQQKLPLTLLLYKSSSETFSKAKSEHKLSLTSKNVFLRSHATHADNLATVDSYRDDITDSEKKLKYYTGIELKLLPTAQTTVSVSQEGFPSKDTGLSSGVGTLGKIRIRPELVEGLPRRGKNGARTPKAPLTKLTWNPNRSFTPKTLGFYYKKGLLNRKDIKIKQDAIDSQAYKSQYYAKQYVPSVSLFGSATKNTMRTGNSTSPKEVGLQISWSFFDGASNYFNKSAADAEKMKSILEKNDLTAQVKLEIQQSYSALQKEIKKLEAEDASYNQAKNEFILRRKEFEVGSISPVDFRTAEYTYEAARFAWLNQVATTALKEQTLLYTCGYPPEYRSVLTNCHS